MFMELWHPVSSGSLVCVTNKRHAYRYDPFNKGESYRRIPKSEIIRKEDGKSYVKYDLTSPKDEFVCLNDEFDNAKFDDGNIANPKIHWVSPRKFKLPDFQKDIASNIGWKKIPLSMLNRNLINKKEYTLKNEGNSNDTADIWASKWGQFAMAVKDIKSGEVKDVVFLEIAEKTSSTPNKNGSKSVSKTGQVKLTRKYWSFEEDAKVSSSKSKTPIYFNPGKLIAEAFDRFRPHPKCTHLIYADGDFMNCSLSNLMWTTYSAQTASIIARIYDMHDPITKLIRDRRAKNFNFS